MRILITGATGLIGREIGKRLARAGHQINIVSRNPQRAALDLSFPARVFAWNGHPDVFPAEALEGIDAIIHLAGEPVAEGRWTAAKKRRIRDSRVEGTKRLVEAIVQHPRCRSSLKAFIHGSAVGIYGNRGDEILTEASEPGADFLARVCREWEDAALQLGQDERCRHVRTVTIRTGIVLSRKGGAFLKMIPPFRAGLGGPIAGGRQWMSWIHLDDIVGLFLFALDNTNCTGVLNGTAPEPVTNAELSRVMGRQLKVPAFMPVPAIALRILYGEMSESLLASQRASAERALQLGFEFSFTSLQNALSDLSTPWREGYEEIVSEQWIPQPVETVFRFFSDEMNLEKLTPPFLNFHVVRKSTPEITNGTIIDYRLRLHRLPLTWQSRIEDWQPGRRFIDLQVRGPYRHWHHTHEFEKLGNGTLIRDRVLYQVPLGLLGRLAAGPKVAADVSRIFSYRKQKIGELFGASSSESSQTLGSIGTTGPANQHS